jgi:F-type H+-transporting ATPase subunit epsilon
MAAPAGTSRGDGLRVSVISPERTLFDGVADSVIVPAWDGELGILQGHAPLMALLGVGQIRIRRGQQTEHFHVSGGFLQVVNNRVSILSEAAEGAA